MHVCAVVVLRFQTEKQTVGASDSDRYRCDVSLLASSDGWPHEPGAAADIKLTVLVDTAAFRGTVSVRADGRLSCQFIQALKFGDHF